LFLGSLNFLQNVNHLTPDEWLLNYEIEIELVVLRPREIQESGLPCDRHTRSENLTSAWGFGGV